LITLRARRVIGGLVDPCSKTVHNPVATLRISRSNRPS
jgi:hypothetical protein